MLYYDIFHYPLTAPEIFAFTDTGTTSLKDVELTLEAMSEAQIISKWNDFYSIANAEEIGKRRLKGNAIAMRMMPLALKRARLIAKFPFVRAVMASGSLSKNYMDEKSDLDFFIVTENNRLWIARMLLVLFKKIFLFNSHKTFCVNYFVDADHLSIEEKNVYTATELATVIPLTGRGFYEKLIAANANWMFDYFPNWSPGNSVNVITKPTSWIRDLLERLLNNSFGDWLDTFFMKKTVDRWRLRYGSTHTEADFKIAFKSKKYVSKGHPKNFQKTVLKILEEKIKEFERKFQSV